MVLKNVKAMVVISMILVLSFFLPHIAYARSDQELYKALINGERILKDREFREEEKPTVYLTFDDGPSYLTPQVLDILGKEGINATFFVLGVSIENHKEILRRIAKEGHSIGNHSYSHQYSKIYKSFSDYFSEIQKTEKLIFDTTGIRTSLIRAPGGTYKNWDSFYFYYMDQSDYLIYDWNVDSGDSRRRGVPTKEIVNRVKSTKLAKKIIVLMHDSGGHKNTVNALPDIIKFYRDLGYKFDVLSENVEPIMQPMTVSRWERENQFQMKGSFVRKLSETEAVFNENYHYTNNKAIETKLKEIAKDVGETIASQEVIKREGIKSLTASAIPIYESNRIKEGKGQNSLFDFNIKKNNDGKKFKLLSYLENFINKLKKEFSFTVNWLMNFSSKSFFTFPYFLIYNNF